MKRRKFLKYLCGVIPVSLIWPSWLLTQKLMPKLKGTFSCEYYKDGKLHQFEDATVYESCTENLDDILLGIVKREGWSERYIYIKSE